MNIKALLASKIKAAMSAIEVPEAFGAHVTVSKNPKFGDYQANGAMAAAKALKTKPRDLAQLIVDNLALDGIASTMEIAGPGFINIHLDQHWLAKQLSEVAKDSRLSIAKKVVPETVVVDYSSPNLAKEMHVGHLRSTIIGDAVARILEFVGDKVIRQNHVGDWGTQFGMLIAELEHQLSDGEKAELALADLESFYQQSKKHFDEDQNFANTARDYVVKLQSGDHNILQLWEKFREISLAHNQAAYDKLNVTLSANDVYGESAYNNDLSTLVSELKERHLALEDKGALVVKLDEFKNKDGETLGIIVQKNDGGFLYTTTDLAAIRYRTEKLGATRILVFSDARQSQHMKQVFAIAEKAGFIQAGKVSLEHHAFGMMLNKEGKPFKTRDGGTIKLSGLIDEACERARGAIKEKNNHIDESEITAIAQSVGVGAIKYADLAKTRTNDYVFDWETMLSFEGNTGPYLQYAYARICAIFRKAEIHMHTFDADIVLEQPQEKALALKLLQFPEAIEQVAEDAFPHTLCTYLYGLASDYMSFYESCPILKEGIQASIKGSRLQLCKTSAKTLSKGLDLLGIDVLEKM